MNKTLTVTIPQACKLTGLGRSTIYRLFDDGKIRRLKAGSRTLIKMDDLEAYIESLTTPTE
ncbi:helix-turn-helix domain-containing protein [Hellea sp.]|nr:helix-turn-helix domain-containing protein [Hellea sp.]